jgi:ribonuclease HI
VEYSGFADDVAFWVTGEDVEELGRKAAAALDGVSRWAERYRITLNQQKTEACLFTNSTGERRWDPGLVLDGEAVRMKKELKLLGVLYDQGLRFAGQLKAVTEKMRKRTRVLLALTGKSWGWDRDSMVRVYKALVESVVWYGAAGWLPWMTMTGYNRLEEAQREALRTAAGLVRKAPCEAIYFETGVDPIRVEAKRRALTAYEKSMRLEASNPRRVICERTSRRRLKANKGWREQAKRECERMLPGPRRSLAVKRGCPWAGVGDCGVTLCADLLEPITKDDSEEKRRCVARRTMEAHGHMDMVIFTDGSVEGGVDNGGSAAVARYQGEVVVRREAAGKVCSSYEAESRAMRMALEVVAERRPAKAIIATDSRALVQALQNGACSVNATLEEVKVKLVEAAAGSQVTIQWTPGHVGTEGNEEADREANDARGIEQGTVPVCWEAAKRKVRREVQWRPELNERLAEVYGQPIKRACLTRREAVTMAQLRSGHCAKTAYWRHRVNLQWTATCPDCEEDEEKDHIFVCPRWVKIRTEMGIRGKECLREESLAAGYLRRVKPDWMA